MHLRSLENDEEDFVAHDGVSGYHLSSVFGIFLRREEGGHGRGDKKKKNSPPSTGHFGNTK
jgi:hypothetical protein